jgi:hypothetical protein
MLFLRAARCVNHNQTNQQPNQQPSLPSLELRRGGLTAQAAATVTPLLPWHRQPPRTLHALLLHTSGHAPAVVHTSTSVMQRPSSRRCRQLNARTLLPGRAPEPKPPLPATSPPSVVSACATAAAGVVCVC